MHLQITGRLDPGETFATFPLDAAYIIPAKNASRLELELINVIICKQENHTHFDPPPTEKYPEDPNRYPETVRIVRPRPQPLVFRRRTAIHEPNLRLPARTRRNVEDADDNDNDDDENIDPNILSEMEVHYSASFREPIFEFKIFDFPKLSLDNLILTVLEVTFVSAVVSHFQQLLQQQPRFELLDDPGEERDRRARKKIVRIVLPPQTRFMCSSQDFFTYLGMDEEAKPIENTGMFGLENDDSEIFKVFESRESQPISLKFKFRGRNLDAPESFTVYFQKMNSLVSSTIKITDFCRQNSLATSTFFQRILNFAVEALDLPGGSLKVFLLDDLKTLEFDLSAEHIRAENSSDNFRIFFKFGTKIGELLGLAVDEYTWILSPRRPGSLVLETVEPATVEDVQLCNKILESSKIDMLNQRSRHETVKKWREMYKAEMKAKSDAERAEIFDAGGEEFEFEIEDRHQSGQDSFDIVDIPNPLPRPPTSFVVTNLPKKHICTMPNIFPDYFSLILREGEPLDYLTNSRGLCSVLGLIRKLQPQIVPNTCIIKNVETVKSLSIEFVDESLNTIKVGPNDPPVWIKLDFRCKTGTNY